MLAQLVVTTMFFSIILPVYVVVPYMYYSVVNFEAFDHIPQSVYEFRSVHVLQM